MRTPLAGADVPLADTISVTAYVDSPVGVTSVKAKHRRRQAFVTAKGAGNIWTAKIPSTGLQAGKQLTVTVVRDGLRAATTTATRAIKLGGSPLPRARSARARTPGPTSR